MPLIDLKTDLKLLKYGNDRPGGGSSDQPYIQTDINRVDTGFNRLRLTRFDDGLIRGGIIGATNSSVVDAIRIGKFLTDAPKGPLFIAKQIGLQLSNPRLETRKLSTNNPTTGGGLLRNVGNFILNAANQIVNAVGPTRIYNLGINTLAQVPVNAFGIHFNRHGLLPVQNEDTKYINVVANNNLGNNNRLVGLKNKFELGDGDAEISNQFNLRNARRINREANSQGRTNNRLINRSLREGARTEGFEFNRLRFKRQKLDTTTLTIDSYIGGPNSVYGVGRTIINRYAFTEDKGKIEESRNRNYVSQTLPTISIGKTWDYEISTFTDSALSANTFILDSDTAIASGSFQNFTVPTSFFSFDNASGFALVNGERQAFTYIDPNTFNGAVSSGLGQRNKLSAWNRSKNIGRFSGVPTDPNEIAAVIGQTASLNDPQNNLQDNPWVNQITASNDLGKGKNAISNYTSSISTDETIIKQGIDQTVVSYGNSKTYTELRNRINKTSTVNHNLFKTDNTFTINRGDTDFKYVASQLKDKFKRTNDTIVADDTMALKFTPLDPFTGNALNTLNFLGYLTEYSEDYNSTWNPTRYVGRAESFYIFTEFKRTVSVGFQIPCFNKEELMSKHRLFSELTSTLAGKYENNLLGGIITRLKIGNYINNQPGIITNLNFSPIQDSNWDLDKKLAYYLKVTFGFTLIHDYLPQYMEGGFIFKDPEPNFVSE